MDFKLINNLASSFLLGDVGVEISNIEDNIFDDEDSIFLRFTMSKDLNQLLTNGSLTLNIDSQNLSIDEALKFFNFQNEYDDNWIVSSTPPDNPINGRGWYNIVDNILYIWDSTRSKWLSASRQILTLTRNNTWDDNYLRPGMITDVNVSGVMLSKNATLVGMIIRARDGNFSKGASIEIDFNLVLDFTINSLQYINNDLNIDLNAGQILYLYSWSTGASLQDVIANLEFAWRY